MQCEQFTEQAGYTLCITTEMSKTHRFAASYDGYFCCSSCSLFVSLQDLGSVISVSRALQDNSNMHMMQKIANLLIKMNMTCYGCGISLCWIICLLVTPCVCCDPFARGCDKFLSPLTLGWAWHEIRERSGNDGVPKKKTLWEIKIGTMPRNRTQYRDNL